MTDARVLPRDFKIHNYASRWTYIAQLRNTSTIFFLISNIEYFASWLGALYRN